MIGSQQSLLVFQGRSAVTDSQLLLSAPQIESRENIIERSEARMELPQPEIYMCDEFIPELFCRADFVCFQRPLYGCE